MSHDELLKNSNSFPQKKKLIESKPTDHVGATAVDLSSRLPEAVFFRWPLVNENGAMEKYCKFGDK